MASPLASEERTERGGLIPVGERAAGVEVAETEELRMERSDTRAKTEKRILMANECGKRTTESSKGSGNERQ
jgi:hypothetical protein